MWLAINNKQKWHNYVLCDLKKKYAWTAIDPNSWTDVSQLSTWCPVHGAPCIDFHWKSNMCHVTWFHSTLHSMYICPGLLKVTALITCLIPDRGIWSGRIIWPVSCLTITLLKEYICCNYRNKLRLYSFIINMPCDAFISKTTLSGMVNSPDEAWNTVVRVQIQAWSYAQPSCVLPIQSALWTSEV